VRAFLHEVQQANTMQIVRTKRRPWVKKSFSAAVHLFCFAWLSVYYLLAAAVWDELENEVYIYNYTWNFALIDFFVWKVIPASAFLVLVWRLSIIFRNNGTVQQH
jgi:hypothetical protein